MSPFVARLRHADRFGRCPLIGVYRNRPAHRENDANDPYAKSAVLRGGLERHMRRRELITIHGGRLAGHACSRPLGSAITTVQSDPNSLSTPAGIQEDNNQLR